jgi:bifunctional DNA-binding transcriptional regulator/antitoxin component of YhaV-PrlF toxin-antitoxin module
LANELVLGITIVGPRGTTTVPGRVRESLGLEPTLGKRVKILWTEEGGEIVVSKGTPQSSFRKSLLRRDGRAAIPKHIRNALDLKPSRTGVDKVVWMRKGDEVIVRKGTPQSTPTD